MGAGHSVSSDNRHVHVGQLDLGPVLGEENICAFNISMEDIHVMQNCKPFETVIGYLPDGALVDYLLAVFMFGDHLKDIPSFQTLSYDAESVCELVKEGVFVAEYAGVVDAGEDPDFIEAVGQFFFIESGDPDFFEGVLASIFLAFDPVDD